MEKHEKLHPSPNDDATRWIAAAVEALEDAHQQWHDAESEYHEPGSFRRHVESLIQTVRNVTFRLQSQRGDGPPDFDRWYSEWQALMREDPVMSWLNESRVEITKRGGLRKTSRVLVKRIESYDDPRSVLLNLPADTPTALVVQRAINAIPPKYRPYQAIEVQRRWEADDLPGWELLGAVAYCMRFLTGILRYAFDASHGPFATPPAEYVSSSELLPCLVVTPDMVPSAFAADTGEPYILEIERRKSAVTPEEAARKYGLSVPGALKGKEFDLEAFGAMVHNTSRTVFKKDGYVIPILFLVKHPHLIRQFVVQYEDKRDKFMMWREFGHIVFHEGFDAFIHTGETWGTTMVDQTTPYVEISELPGKREHIVTTLESATGVRQLWQSEIKRLFGIPMLRAVEVGNYVGGDFVDSASPIRKAWKLRADLGLTADGSSGFS